MERTNKLGTVQFRPSVMSDSLWPHGRQYTRPPCPSTTPAVYPNSYPLSQWCHWPSHPLSSPSPSTFNLSQHQGLFKWVSSSHQLAKVLEFQLHISPSNECSGIISFRMDCLDLCCPRDSQESSPTPQFTSINSSVLSFLYSQTHIHTWWLEKP